MLCSLYKFQHSNSNVKFLSPSIFLPLQRNACTVIRRIKFMHSAYIVCNKMLYYMATSISSRWPKFCPVISFPSRQGGAILPTWDYQPYNKSLSDKACSVNMDGYWPCSFLVCLWTSTPSRSINTQKELGQYPAILTSPLENNPYLSHYNALITSPEWPHTNHETFFKGNSCLLCIV